MPLAHHHAFHAGCTRPPFQALPTYVGSLAFVSGFLIRFDDMPPAWRVSRALCGATGVRHTIAAGMRAVWGSIAAAINACIATPEKCLIATGCLTLANMSIIVPQWYARANPLAYSFTARERRNRTRPFVCFPASRQLLCIP